MKRLKKIRSKGKAPISLMVDKYNGDAIILPAKNRLVEKFYDDGFSDSLHFIAIFMFVLDFGFFTVAVFPSILSGAGKDDSYLLGTPLILSIICLLVFMVVAIIEISKESAFTVLHMESQKVVELSFSQKQLSHIENISDQQLRELYDQTMKTRGLNKLINQINRELNKNIDTFVKDDLSKRRSDLKRKHDLINTNIDSIMYFIESALSQFSEAEKKIEKERNTNSTIKSLSEIDELERKIY